MRIMAILTVVWFFVMALAAAASHLMVSLPGGDRYVDLAVASLTVDFVCWWLGILMAPVVLIGWPVVLLVRLTRRKQKPAMPGVFFPNEPGLYARDPDTGKFHKVGPPC